MEIILIKQLLVDFNKTVERNRNNEALGDKETSTYFSFCDA
jgi:hypothetical protein